MQRAFCFEVHESAEFFFEWFKGAGGCGECILQGFPRGKSWKHRALSVLFRTLWSVARH